MDLGMKRILQSIPGMRPDRLKLSTESKRALNEAFHEFGQAAQKVGGAVEKVFLDNVSPPPPDVAKSNGKGEHHEEA
jgi:hypothetical protein